MPTQSMMVESLPIARMTDGARYRERPAGKTVRLVKKVLCAVLLGASLFVGAVRAQGVLMPPSETAPRNTLALVAGNVGVRQCLGEMSSLSALGVQGTLGNDVLFDWDRKRMGGGPAFALIGLQYASRGAALSVNAVPEVDGSCSIAAERISVEPLACSAVAQKELVGYQATTLLPHMTVYTQAKAAGSSVSLFDAPPGCLVIRRYVTFASGVTGR